MKLITESVHVLGKCVLYGGSGLNGAIDCFGDNIGDLINTSMALQRSLVE
jgi:hypothetical protein